MNGHFRAGSVDHASAVESYFIYGDAGPAIARVRERHLIDQQRSANGADVRRLVGYADEGVAIARAAERQRAARPRHGRRVETRPIEQSPVARFRMGLADLLIATGHRIAGASLASVAFGAGEAAAGAGSRIIDIEPEGSALS
jgi:hypothetical protein